MPLTPAERMAILGEVLGQIQTANYIYDLGRGASQWSVIPPPPGTRLNCQAAARLAKEMAEQRGVDRLQVVATDIPDGFFVPAAEGVTALGGNQPPVRTPAVRGWEFDNHYRLKDLELNKVYDPTFGTSGAFNPVGVKCTATQVAFPKMISIYGGKYKIIRSNTYEAEVLDLAAVLPVHLVDNDDYR